MVLPHLSIEVCLDLQVIVEAVHELTQLTVQNRQPFKKQSVDNELLGLRDSILAPWSTIKYRFLDSKKLSRA